MRGNTALVEQGRSESWSEVLARAELAASTYCTCIAGARAQFVHEHSCITCTVCARA